MAASTSMMAPGVLFPSKYTSSSSISSLGRSCHQLTRGILPLCFSPLTPSLIGMGAQSDSSDDHYSTHDEYNFPHETASVSWDTRANQSVAQDHKRRHKRSDVYDYFEKITLTGEWIPDKNEYCYTYKCRHCSIAIYVLVSLILGHQNHLDQSTQIWVQDWQRKRK
ncbi:hypothetical protein O181_015551 [Austropuccinia psidii MF-1]|uniref:Uncharacterized protein n=1 Tax=Austropuccinia psidii MF-1 TaxID=1389203 RepID=A0A9Q3C3Z1_9BASI|nr:hypothetical protein [Austropuccinia psidii MF-1]